MKTAYVCSVLLLSLMLLSCGGKNDKKNDDFKYETERTGQQKTPVVENTDKASERIDLKSKGVGPVKSITLNSKIDQNMVLHGKEVFDRLCLACHKTGKKFIGPAPDKILERRSPEWVMNMMLNPEVMVKEDPLAKDLFLEFNGSPMANQNLTQDEARAVLEYFRTL